MAGRGRMPPPHVGHPLSGPGMMHPEAFGPGLRHPLGPHPLDLFPPPPEFLEQKLADQHAEMQRLAAENQRLGATHVALRQELAAAQQELQRVEAQMAAIRNEKEHQIRSILDKSAKMEAELRGSESLKVEVQQARADAQNLMSIRQDLTAQVQQLTQELQRAHAEIQQVPALHAELEGLRQEFQRARTAFEYEKKATSDQVEQIKAMEKNLYSMAREVEKLRAELVNSPDKRSRAGPYGAGFKDPDVSFGPGGPNTYADGYGISQIPAAAASGAPYGGPAASRGGYDVPRGGGSQMPVAPVNGTPFGSGPTPGRGGYDVPRSGGSHVRR